MVETILKRMTDNGGPFWSRQDGDIHAPFGNSTIDTLSVIGELGYSIHDNKDILDATEFIFGYQTSDGGFRHSLKSTKLPCLTARIIAALGRLGLSNDQRMTNGYNWLLKKQSSDGGWRCATVKLGNSPITDASNPGTTLYVLDAFRYKVKTIEIETNLDKGVDFLLQHWVVRQPIGPCGFGIGTTFMKIEYPFLRYNLFYYVYVLSFYPSAKNDERFIEAYNELKSKLVDGCVVPENPHKAWRDYISFQKGKVSEMGTKRWIEININLGL